MADRIKGRGGLAGFLFCLALAACTRDPESMIPAGDRAIIRAESQGQRPNTLTSVEDVLARARGTAAPQPGARAIVLHFVEENGEVTVADRDLTQIGILSIGAHEAVLTVGPAPGDTPFARALAASIRARYVERHLPATLHIAETHYDINADTNTARLEFGDPARVK